MVHVPSIFMVPGIIYSMLSRVRRGDQILFVCRTGETKLYNVAPVGVEEFPRSIVSECIVQLLDEDVGDD